MFIPIDFAKLWKPSIANWSLNLDHLDQLDQGHLHNFDQSNHSDKLWSKIYQEDNNKIRIVFYGTHQISFPYLSLKLLSSIGQVYIQGGKGVLDTQVQLLFSHHILNVVNLSSIIHYIINCGGYW